MFVDFSGDFYIGMDECYVCGVLLWCVNDCLVFWIMVEIVGMFLGYFIIYDCYLWCYCEDISVFDGYDIVGENGEVGVFVFFD